MIYIVLGTPRSGTSVTAGILSNLGIEFENSLPASPMNPKGFFQATSLEELFEPADLFIPDPYTPIKYDAWALRKALLKPGEWGIKCSKFAFILQEIAVPYKLIVTERSIQASIDSWRRWTNDPNAETIIKNAKIAINRALQLNTVPVLTVNFEDIFENTVQTVTALANFVNKPINQVALDFVDPELNRYGY
jgi:hypothetical protein